MFLYVGVCLVQVVLLPLACFWLLAKAANGLVAVKTPTGARRS
jgi:hypothetical protein